MNLCTVHQFRKDWRRFLKYFLYKTKDRGGVYLQSQVCTDRCSRCVDPHRSHHSDMGLTDTHSSPAHSAVLPSQPDTHSGTFTQSKDVTVTALACKNADKLEKTMPAYLSEVSANYQ